MKQSRFYLKSATLAGFVLLIAGFVLYRSGNADALFGESENLPIRTESNKAEEVNVDTPAAPDYSMEHLPSSKDMLLPDKKRPPNRPVGNLESMPMAKDSPIPPPFITISGDTNYRRNFYLMTSSKLGHIFTGRDSLSRLHFQIDTGALKPVFMMPGSKSAPIILQELDSLKKKDKN